MSADSHFLAINFTFAQQIKHLLLPYYLNKTEGNEALVQDIFSQERKYFFEQLDKDVCNRLMSTWWVFSEPDRQRVKIGLVHLTLRVYLEKNPQATEQEKEEYLTSLLEEERPSVFTRPFLEKLRLYKLQENLAWVDLEQIEHLKNHPLELLKMVLTHNGHAYPQTSFVTPFEFPVESIRSLDEAALLWHHLKNGTMYAESFLGNELTKTLREGYFPFLAQAWQEQAIADKVLNFFHSSSSNTTEIYFDGFAFHNAQGKTFADLLQTAGIREILAELPPDLKSSYLRAALEKKMGESSRYPIGSLWHSIESCLFKLDHYYSPLHSSKVLSKPELLFRFSEVQKEWEKKHNQFPQLLLAAHLAHSNGDTLEGDSWQSRTENLLHYLREEITKALTVEQEFQTAPNPSPTESEHPSWLYWIPIIGSVATLMDGIKDKDWKEVLLGGVFLSLDAWSLSSLARPLTRGLVSMLSNRERLLADALRSLKKTLVLPSDEIGLFDLKVKNSYYAANTIEQIPPGYEAAVKAVRQGAQDQFWRDTDGIEYPLVYLSNEDRVVAVKSQGGSYREVNWSGGEERTKPLIYRDKETGRYGAFALRGGAKEAIQTLIPEAIEQSYTVKEVTELLGMALDQFFYFDSDYKNQLKKVFTVEGSEKFDVLKFYETAYEKSPVLRVFLNQFFNLETDWRIVIKESSVGSYISYQYRTIMLDSTVDQSFLTHAKKYLGNDYVHTLPYKGVQPQIERAAIHEFLHVGTGVDDLFIAKKAIMEHLVRELKINPNILNLRMKDIKDFSVLDKTIGSFVEKYEEKLKEIAQKEQGAIVWLTEKIFSEISSEASTIPHRLRYGSYVNGENIDIKGLRSKVIAINRQLDKSLVDNFALRTEYLLGEKIENREIVREVKSFLDGLELVSPPGAFSDRFIARFVTQDEGLNAFFDDLYRKSKTFKKIFNYYTQDSKSIDPSWNLISLKLNDPAIEPATINKVDNAIYFFNDGSQYLSESGLKNIEKERWFFYHVLEKLTHLSAFDSTEKIERMIAINDHRFHALINQRGAIHQLTDQIFQEAKLPYPKCLSAVFVKSNNEELKQSLLKQQILLNRVIFAEDYQLARSANNPNNCLSCVKMDSVISQSIDESNITLWLLGIAGTGVTALTYLWAKRFRRSSPAKDPFTNIPLLLVESKAALIAAAVTSQLLPVETKTNTPKPQINDVSLPPTLPTLCETYLPQVSFQGALLWATYFFTKKSTKNTKQKEAVNLSSGEAAILAMELVDDFKVFCNQYTTASQRENPFNLFTLQSALTVSIKAKNFAKIYSIIIDEFKAITKNIYPKDERKIVDLIDKFIDEKIFFRKNDTAIIN